MASEVNGGSQWDRVAAELRACREAQQRAWGDIDNTTLGRYLAGEITPEEQQQIDRALDELPELRKLTELVRDVLGESETPVPEPVAHEPTILPFPRRVGSTRSWKQGRPTWFRRRAGLVAAAGLLLALGVALPSSGLSSPQSGQLGEASPLVASRMDLSSALAMRDGKDMPPLMKGGIEGDAAEREDELIARIDASVQALEAKGQKKEAEKLVRRYANNLTRRAMVYQRQGDLARAEPAFNQALTFCAKAWGPEAPQTLRTANSLAEVYEVALNADPGSTAPTAEATFYGNVYSAASPTAQPSSLAVGHSPLPAPAIQHVVEMEPQPRGVTAPVRTSSSYEPPASAPRAKTPGVRATRPSGHAKRYTGAAPGKDVIAYKDAVISYKEAVDLRNRITQQSQSELKASVVPVLTQALRETKDAGERRRLARALGQLGPAARESVPVLLDCYRQATDAPERATVLLAFGQIGPAARQAVPILVDSLQSDSPQVRNCAAAALIQLGPAARSGVHKLALQKPDDPLVRGLVVRINGPEGRIGIDDECECFSVHAIHQTQRDIYNLATNYHVEVLVETADAKRAEKIDKAEDREPKMGEYGVRFRILKDAPGVQVYVSDALQKQGLTDVRLRQAVEPYVKNKQFDRGLREGVLLVARFEAEQGKK
jgi:hypothetical protein